MIKDTQQTVLNKIGSRLKGYQTAFRNTQTHILITNSASTKDSLFHRQRHNCVQGCNPPTVKGQFDDAQDIEDKEKEVALTLLNAHKITAAGYATSTILPVSPYCHRNQHSMQQYHENYLTHQRTMQLPSPSSPRALSPTLAPNKRSTTKVERVAAGTRGAMVLGHALSGIGGTMACQAGPPRQSSIPPRELSFSEPKVVGGVIRKRPDPLKSNDINCPNPADVIFGRGTAANTHPGNVFFRFQVTQYHDRYVRSRNNAAKSLIVRFIRDAIKARGGRFLKWQVARKIWFIVTERESTVKTMQSLYDVKTPNGADCRIGIKSYSTEAFGRKTNTTESNNHRENTNGNWNRNGKEMTVMDASYTDQSSTMTNTAATSATAENGGLPHSSFPSKKRPIKLGPVFTKPHMFSTNEPVERVRKKLKPNLTTSPTLEHTPTPPTTTTTPPLEISFTATTIPGTVVKPLPLKKATFHKEPSSSPSDCINNIALHQQQQQQQIEHQEEQSPSMANTNYRHIALPRPEDVLSGRGGRINGHPGNIHFRLIVSQAQPNYIKSRKKDKSSIAHNIVHSIRQRNGQFLKFHAESGLWHDVGDKKAAEKASQALREGSCVW